MGLHRPHCWSTCLETPPCPCLGASWGSSGVLLQWPPHPRHIHSLCSSVEAHLGRSTQRGRKGQSLSPGLQHLSVLTQCLAHGRAKHMGISSKLTVHNQLFEYRQMLQNARKWAKRLAQANPSQAIVVNTHVYSTSHWVQTLPTEALTSLCSGRSKEWGELF